MKLGDVCTKIGSGATPRGGKKAYKDAGIPIIRSQNVLDWSFTSNGLAFIDEAQAAALANVEVKPCDILLNITGDSVARVCMVPDWCTPARVNQHVSIVRPSSELDPTFLLCFLQSSKSLLLKLASSGATRNALTKGMIEDLDIELPSIDSQRAIASLIGQMQQKIALNQQTNDYLSELAQVLFIGWFEEHAGEREIASLTGGGEYCTLDKLCSRITDGAHKSPKADPDGVYPMLSVKDMRRYGFSYSSCKRISKADYDGMLANDCVPRVDDILVAKDGSYLKEIFITDEQREEAILSSIAIFRPDTRRIAPEVLLQYLKHPRVLKLVSDNFVSGSALPRIVLKDFKKLMLLVPERSVQEGILPALRSIRKLIRVNEEESARLSSLRDLLLPKLMSGEIDVSGVELLMQPNNHLSAY